ncbi:hypothetical protein [Helicobacter sp. 23-1045]
MTILFGLPRLDKVKSRNNEVGIDSAFFVRFAESNAESAFFAFKSILVLIASLRSQILRIAVEVLYL